jgi:hypothetical protein
VQDLHFALCILPSLASVGIYVAFTFPLLAFDVASPWMAFWGVAAIAPLLIHLLSRRRFRQVPWAAMQFLLAAMRKESRRIRVEQWLLLALRMAIVLLLAAALMDWSIDRAAAPGAARPRTHRVFVLDASLSMSARSGDKTRFDEGKDWIAERMDAQFQQGDGTSLVLLAAPPRAIIRAPALERDAFSRELAPLVALHGTADLAATLDVVREVLESARRERSNFDHHEVYFVSDLQRVTWELVGGDRGGDDASRRATLRSRFTELAESADLRVVDLGRPGTPNVAVVNASLAEPTALVGRDNAVRADIKNFADQARENIVAELVSDNRLVATRPVPKIPPREQVSVAFPYRFTAAGSAPLELRLKTEPSDLEIDNYRHLSVLVKDRLRVLCIAGKPGEADFLPFALEPASSNQANGDQAKVEVEVATVLALRGGDLTNFDAIVLANVPQYSAEEARRLVAFLDSGGGLIFLLGDQVIPEAYERQLGGAHDAAARWWPVKLGEVAPAGKYAVDPLDYRHRIAAPFQGQEQAGLLNTPIQRYMRMSTVAGVARAALAIRGSGDPLIVESPARRGRVVVIATPGSLASVDPATKQPWTYWPLWPSFLPVMQESLRLAISGRADQRNSLVGQPLGGTLPGALPQLNVSITMPLPDKRTERVRAIVAGEETRWTFDDTGHAGLYQVSFASPVARTDVYAVNTDPIESDLARIDATELPPELHLMTDPSADSGFNSASRSSPSRLYATLLYAVLALLLCDSSLAWWFGYRSS